MYVILHKLKSPAYKKTRVARMSGNIAVNKEKHTIAHFLTIERAPHLRHTSSSVF